MGAGPAVEAQNIVKQFGQGAEVVRALDDVSVRIAQGEFFTLLGPSGCGKTTLLRCIAGFETPTAGRILLGGRDITGEPPNRRRVNTVFQSYALFPHLTVAQNVAFGLEMLGKSRAEVRQTTERMLALVRLDQLAGRRPDALSGGQQQRVALARALAPQPEVLLLDEPLSALDLKLRKEMQSELKRLQHETGITFVFVTHDQEEALTMSDRIGVMSAGKLLQVGTPRDIYNRPVNRFVADFIGETNFLPARAEGGVIRLASGEAVAQGPGSGPVTVAIRPEQLRLDVLAEGLLPATVEGATYLGTDSHVHLRLSDGSAVVARVPSSPAGDSAPPSGTQVGLRIAPGAVQVLEG
ncbi:Putrescine transport ATP-binding protein PotA [Rubellimicrobium mesophilum DSM 19309]|uniref:Spermidine/putrescine import ATP-binding protein PotA n=1 Tax=Rubellimicrobium mesophilum DSM 19309 TaxID=442562 RepID=A0A017HEH6_9RHOB|nr:ABC transporter ATP-binding protein [Rubellimicrobium mesophilum]EYD72912.1 Putrescine transport ATP-binding protein PotA [Rubellimicrobium mesophilum DSM 19309]